MAMDVPGKRLVEGHSLTIFPSELVGLMGHSGAGKTTLMNALNGYTRPAAGRRVVSTARICTPIMPSSGRRWATCPRTTSSTAT